MEKYYRRILILILSTILLFTNNVGVFANTGETNSVPEDENTMVNDPVYETQVFDDGEDDISDGMHELDEGSDSTNDTWQEADEEGEPTDNASQVEDDGNDFIDETLQEDKGEFDDETLEDEEDEFDDETLQGEEEEIEEEEIEDEEIEEEGEEWVTSLEALVDGVLISVSAGDGVIPKGTSLQVDKLNSSDYQSTIEESTDFTLNNLIVYDINLFDKEGEKIQPNGQVEEIGRAHV